jgi:hypothetical protein
MNHLETELQTCYEAKTMTSSDFFKKKAEEAGIMDGLISPPLLRTDTSIVDGDHMLPSVNRGKKRIENARRSLRLIDLLIQQKKIEN